MARPKSFEPSEALEKALLVFWAHGYAATSMTQLEQAMGIGRKSMYNTFGGKRDLFLAVLDTYSGRVRPPVERDGAGWAEIEMTLHGGPPFKPEHRCCMMVNTSVEGLGLHDEGVAERVRRHKERLVAGLERALRQAIADGDLPEQPVEASALYLFTVLQGISVMARSGLPFEDLHAVADRAAAGLRRG